MRLRHLAAVGCMGLALVAAGCGDDDDDEGAAAGGATTEQSAPVETATAPETVPEAVTETTPAETTPEKSSGGSKKSGLTISKDTKKKPKIAALKGAPPTELVTEDVVKGTGAPVKSGDTLSMDYVGVLAADGSEFDASWDRGQEFEFPIGAGQVIPGWDEGIIGMRKGGRRILVIPSDLAYGPQGSPPAIPPNSALVFVVDLRKINGS